MTTKATTRSRSRIWALAFAACSLSGVMSAGAQETALASADVASSAGRFMGAAPSASPVKQQSAKAVAPKEAAPPADKLPAFPRHAQLYHKGAADFFLDCPEPLTEKQTAALKAIRTKSQRETTEADHRIARADRELWKLTGAASPDTAAIAAAIAEIERTRAQQRMTFIRRVGEAAAVLNDKQRTASIRGWAEVQDQDAPPQAEATAAAAPKPKKRAAKGKSSPPPEPPPADDDGE